MSTPILHGWFKFHREALYDAVWGTSPSTIKVWLTCLAYAHHRAEPGRFVTRDEVIPIPCGVWPTSYQTVAYLAGVSKGVAIGALKRLKKLGRISTQSKPGHWILIQVLDLDTYKANTSQGKHESNTPLTRRDHYLENIEKENISKNISKELEPLTGSSTREQNDWSLFEEEVRTKDRRHDAASYDPAKNRDTGFSRSSSPASSRGSSVRPSWYAREAQRQADEAKAAMSRAVGWYLDEKMETYLHALTNAVEFAQEALANAKQGKLDLKPYEALLEKAQKKLTEGKEMPGVDRSASPLGDSRPNPFGDDGPEGVDPAKAEAQRQAKEKEIRGYAEAAKAKAEEARKAKAEGQSDSVVCGYFFEAIFLAGKFLDRAIGPAWEDEAWEVQNKKWDWERERPELLPLDTRWYREGRTAPEEASPILPSQTNRPNDGASPPKAEDVPGIEEGA